MPLDEVTLPARDLVEGFRGPWRFLSNFYDHPLTWEGLTYPTSEAAFQAGKTTDQELRWYIADALSPLEAKARGRRLPLRPDWDTFWRHAVMRDVLAAKFSDRVLAAQLIATGDALLVESNTWCDQDWGDCTCPAHRAAPGGNLLGLALMDLRDTLTRRPADQWVRVCCTGHRPGSIPAHTRPWVIEELDRVAAKLAAEHGTRIAISGLAIGADLWWAQAAHRAGLKVWGYSPCDDQDRHWTQDWKAQRREVIAHAARVATLSPSFTGRVLHDRNTWMLRDADALVAVVDPRRRRGGTVDALRKARDDMPIIHIDVLNQRTTLAGNPTPHAA